MLRHLQIRDFAIIPSLEQEFRGGFTAISGETGAGKSILVDALGLLLGERSDSAWVRAGAERAELTAEFTTATNPEAAAWLKDQDLDDGEACLLRRSIHAGGRSRAWINGTPVTVQQLAELGGLLVEVHGQSEQLRLVGARRQLELLDETGEHGAALEAVRAAHARWKALSEELARLGETAGLTPAEAELLAYQHDELERHALPAEAVAELTQEHDLLSRSGELLEALEAGAEAADGDEHGAAALLARATHRLQPFRALDPRIDEAAKMLEEALINAREAAGALRRAGEDVDLSPGRLRQVERQLDALGDLARKHGVRMEALAEVRERIGERLAGAEGFAERRVQLEKQIAAALEGYRKQAAALGEQRSRHARELAARVEALMAELGMQGGVFRIMVTHDPEGPPSPRGDDRVAIEVSANPGIPPGPLGKIASGGELARIGLAIKVAASGAAGRTHVFDEIDAGVGGDTANAVGRLLQKVAAGGQALCVTHLAQVAVRADHQLRVTKRSSADATTVGATTLAAAEREEEIARMLGGKVSEQSRAHAREMLAAARGAVH